MISKLHTTSIYVTDQERAVDFFVNKLGFTVFANIPMGEGPNNSWIEVGPAAATTRIFLEPSSEPRPTFTLVFACDDARATLAELREQGVEISKDVTTESWGTFFHFKDPDGNEFLVNQATEQQAMQQAQS